MRVIHINVSPILPLLNTASSSFAMWVKVPRRDVPNELQVKSIGSQVTLKFVYPYPVNKLKEIKVTPNVQIYLCHVNNRIEEIYLPVRGFYSELRNLIDWIRGEEKKINMESIRMNWRLIAAVIQLEFDNLFIPAQ